MNIDSMNGRSLKTIAVVGGGASGISIVAHIVEKLIVRPLPLGASVEIALFEKNRRIGPGLAYGTSSDSNLLNTPARTMGIYASNPHHFIQWLQNNPSKWQSEFPFLTIESNSTPPRRLYGIYLENMSLEIADKAKKHGIGLQYRHAQVLDMDIKKNGISLQCSNGNALLADVVILAIGGFESSSFQHLKSLKGYFPSPYADEEKLCDIPLFKDVCIIGTRLSAIDAVLMLKNTGHKGKIICASKTGMLPSVQGLWGKYERKFLTKERLSFLTQEGQKKLPLNTLLALISKEIKRAERRAFRWQTFNDKRAAAKVILKKEIAAATHKERKWQAALYDTNELLTPIWQVLSDEDKQIIIDKYLGLFLTYRAAFPIENAKKLYQLMKKEELEILPDFNSVQYDSAKEKFRLVFKETVVETSFVVNATGNCSDITKTQDLFVTKLRDKGLIVSHPFGGILLDEKTLNIIDNFGCRHSSIFVIGALARGVDLVTNLLEYIAKTSERIAHAIVEQIRETNDQ